MRLRLFLLLAMSLGPALGKAASTHSITLSWTDTQNPTGTTYNVYRATGTCPASGLGSLTFASVATALPLAPYTDSAVTAGSAYCYYLTAGPVAGQSAPSSTAGGIIPTAFAPSTIVLVLQPKSVTVTWIDTVNPSGTLYNLYRASAACPASGLGSLAYSTVATGLALAPYIDSTVTPGVAYCYYLTAGPVATQSAPSSTSGGSTPSTYPPNSVTIVIQ